MKRIYSTIIVLMAAVVMMAQDTQYLPISVAFEEPSEMFPAGAKVQVKNRLTQLLAKNGVASMDYFSQFFITVFAVPQTKDVIPGPPMKISEKLDLTFYIADYTNKVVFSTAQQTVRGIGETETKCYMNALSHININTKEMASFVEEGKKRILDYYEHEAPNMIKKAQMLIKTQQYEEAMALMCTVPSQCSHYDAAMDCGIEAYRAYRQQLCYELLGQARTEWAAAQNAMGAAAAGQYLAQITPDMGCYDEAMKLYDEVKGKVLDDWKFEMKKYQDTVDIRKAEINAMREVGVAFGKGQQPTSTNIGFIR